MITFFIVLTEIVGEKESRQRIGMRMMGLSNGPYWLVWYPLSLFLSFFFFPSLFFGGKNVFHEKYKYFTIILSFSGVWVCSVRVNKCGGFDWRKGSEVEE